MKAQYTKDRAYRIVQRANGKYRLQIANGAKPNNSGEHGWDNVGPVLDRDGADAALRARQPKEG